MTRVRYDVYVNAMVFLLRLVSGAEAGWKWMSAEWAESRKHKGVEHNDMGQTGKHSIDIICHVLGGRHSNNQQHTRRWRGRRRRPGRQERRDK